MTARWEAEMRQFSASVDARADQELDLLPEIFKLHDQLAVIQNQEPRA